METERSIVRIRELVDGNGLTGRIVAADETFFVEPVRGRDVGLTGGREPYAGDLAEDLLALAPPVADLTLVSSVYGGIETAGDGVCALTAAENYDGGIVMVPCGEAAIRGGGDGDAIGRRSDERPLAEQALV